MVAWKGLLGVVGYWITREKDKAVIDDMPFRLQYIWTTALLFVFQLLLTLSELIGKYYSSLCRQLELENYLQFILKYDSSMTNSVGFFVSQDQVL